MRLRAATRQSPLALWQARWVQSALEAAHPGLEVELVAMTSAPDTDLSVTISEIGGKGAFAKEVQQAVLDGRADFAVHSAKDLPSTGVEGLVLACVPERGDARDVLVGSTLIDLPVGATVATGSNRRRTQLQDLRPDLRFVELRGNIQRRVDLAGHDGVTAVTAPPSCSPRSSTPRAGGRSMPSGRSSSPSAATATCPPAPTPPSRTTTTS